MKITIFPDRWAHYAVEREIAWADLCEWFANPPVFASKESAGLIKLATFGTVRSENECLRHDANMIECYGVEGDYDGGVIPMEYAAIALREAGVRALLYTSPGHAPDLPRWRILAPLSKPCKPSERRQYVERLNGVLGGILAPESFTASQAFYYGRVEGREYETLIS